MKQETLAAEAAERAKADIAIQITNETEPEIDVNVCLAEQVGVGTKDDVPASAMPLVFQGHEIRMVDQDGEPWWVAKDVCDLLYLKSRAEAVRRLDDDEKGLRIFHTLGGPQKLVIVNEPGLYNLVHSSQKPEAKAFKRWIRHEVLPAIRKTGSYNVHVIQEVSDAKPTIGQDITNMMTSLGNILGSIYDRLNTIDDRITQISVNHVQALPESTTVTVTAKPKHRDQWVGTERGVADEIEQALIWLSAGKNHLQAALNESVSSDVVTAS